jgi:hypothetical protein
MQELQKEERVENRMEGKGKNERDKIRREISK